ncbi:IS21-like element helper ATPase IstB [Sporomusa sphaeroides]|jgi:DNA replication protein DnaC|uniref:IS21 family transposase ISChy4 n=1 Tax=Sporomusa sphaeroides DSM 2875 TaxID=1337886 RepID=A0A1U7MA71_9FIRM|nr:IS21-like element helper ATPase IstB [Sporomusa sphaeroides]OLS54367.1 chromosomal replication initiator protein DnaA [Sporomusa sphaeroides DSM 2875]CVK21663.1 transposase/IS protein [Sporomusa sphaeroides DSM 2875]
MIELEHTRDLLKELGLSTAAELLDARLEAAAHSELTYLSFLGGLLGVEKAERKRRSEETRMKLSRLPHRKTLDEFDFGFQPSIDRRQIKELSTLAFAARSENVVFLGPPGVGKTHLAVGLAVEALRAGLTVYFVSLSQLIADLKKSLLTGRLDRRWRVYLRPDILIVDEVGYAQLDREAAELMFQLVCSRYEKGSIILTSNKFFSDWGELMSDTVIATALLDRLLHHAHVINIRGDTYRLKDRLKTGVKTVPPADINGVDKTVTL